MPSFPRLVAAAATTTTTTIRRRRNVIVDGVHNMAQVLEPSVQIALVNDERELSLSSS